MAMMSPPLPEWRMAASVRVFSLLADSPKRDEVELLKGIQRGLAPCIPIVPLSRAICNLTKYKSLLAS